MTFSTRPFNQRLSAMGDEAEGVFEAVWPGSWVRYGLNRPPISMKNLGPMVRYTPDYLTNKKLVEVMGLGRDRTLKLKVEKFAALLGWNDIHPTSMFVWDTTQQQYTDFEVTDLVDACGGATIKLFPEGKAYLPLHVDALPGEWRKRDQET